MVRLDQIVRATFKQIFEEGKGVWQVEIGERIPEEGGQLMQR